MTSTPATDNKGIPLPPPPPPIPLSLSKSSLTPFTVNVPPPPPLPSPRLVREGDLDWTVSSILSDNLSVRAVERGTPVAIKRSRDVLQKMQYRLRNKMKKRGGVSAGGRQEVERGDDGKVDIKVRVSDMFREFKLFFNYILYSYKHKCMPVFYCYNFAYGGPEGPCQLPISTNWKSVMRNVQIGSRKRLKSVIDMSPLGHHICHSISL